MSDEVNAGVCRRSLARGIVLGAVVSLAFVEWRLQTKRYVIIEDIREDYPHVE